MCFDALVRFGERNQQKKHHYSSNLYPKYESLLNDSKTLQDQELLFVSVFMDRLVNQATTDRTLTSISGSSGSLSNKQPR